MRVLLREQRRQRVLAGRPRPLLLRSAQFLRTPHLAHGQAWRRMALRRLADRARVHRARPGRDPARPRRQGHRCAREPAQHRGRTVPGAEAARWAARTSTTACATPSSRPSKACAGWARASPRCPRCSACWWSAPTCARTIRCSRCACAALRPAQGLRDPRPRRRLGDEHRRQVPRRPATGCRP